MYIKYGVLTEDKQFLRIDRETALYWTEYVLKYKEANNLRSQAANVSLFNYLLLDVITFL